MHILTNSVVDLALEQYDQLDVTSPAEADRFFARFGPGKILADVDRPHERFADYQELLQRLLDRNRARYAQLHKGTPFYLMACLAFDARAFETALTYIDAAISEDARSNPSGWRTTPAGRFLQLGEPQPPAGNEMVPRIRACLEREIARFVGSTGTTIKLASFQGGFVKALLEHQNPGARNIISAFYVFLLEAEDRLTELRLRSAAGGSTGPAIAVLFSGGLILESLLKNLYPGLTTLGAIFHDARFLQRFPANLPTSANSLGEVIKGVAGDTVESALGTTARLRNTTGHNLIWDDVFTDPDKFQVLVQQEVNAILHVVSRHYP